MIMVVSSLVAVNDKDWTKWSNRINGTRRIVITTRGMILRVVRRFSVMPEKAIPAIFTPQKTARTMISMRSMEAILKTVMYCLIPAAMVEIPKMEEIQ
jgi:hypothetical protein